MIPTEIVVESNQTGAGQFQASARACAVANDLIAFAYALTLTLVGGVLTFRTDVFSPSLILFGVGCSDNSTRIHHTELCLSGAAVAFKLLLIQSVLA